jgi:DNA-binding NarL/FixJ family response regulator
MIFVSRSKFFLEGMSRVLGKKSNDLRILTKTSSRGIRSLLNEIKPEFLFLDNRSSQYDIEKFTDLIAKEAPHTKVIVFSDQTKHKISSPHVIYINKRTTSSELISIIKKEKKNGSAKKRGIERATYPKSSPSLHAIPGIHA